MNYFENRIAQRGETSGFSVGGKIRSGTKAISKKAAANPIAARLYKQALEGKISFREAEKKIAQETDIRNPFFPRNTPEFHAHAWDMGTGGQATRQKIMDLYGEMREGDTSPKLYRFPIVFPEVGTDVNAIIRGGLSVQGGGPNTVRYWSSFNDAGVQVCNHLPEVVASDLAQRRAGKPLRRPERTPVERGLCVPQECNEFAMGMCRFSGKLRFYIPGVTGAGLFELHSGSAQAATDMYMRITQALRAMGGKIINFTHDGRPVFWMTKKLVSRGYFDEEGKPKVGEQWVPDLDMEIEMPKVIMIAQARAQAKAEPMYPLADDKPQSLCTPSAWSQPDAPVVSAVSNATVHEGAAEPHDDAVVDIVAKSDESPRQPAQAEEPPAAEKGQGGREASNSEGDIQQMFDHAQRLNYLDDLKAWIDSKCQGDISAAQEKWRSYVMRLGPRVKEYLAMVEYLRSQGINAELAADYLKIKFGPIGSGARLEEMLQHLYELCNDGASVATSVMEEEIDRVVPV